MIIDCENVYTKKLIPIIESLKNWKVILVVGHTQKIEVPNAKFVEVLKVDGSGHNYADFVIVTELSRQIMSTKYQSSCIISNDTGFNAAVNYLKKLGYIVNRYGLVEFKKRFDKKKSLEIKSIKDSLKTKETLTKTEKTVSKLLKSKGGYKDNICVKTNIKSTAERKKIRELLAPYLSTDKIKDKIKVLVKQSVDFIYYLLNHYNKNFTYGFIRNHLKKSCGPSNADIYQMFINSKILREDKIDLSVKTINKFLGSLAA